MSRSSSCADVPAQVFLVVPSYGELWEGTVQALLTPTRPHSGTKVSVVLKNSSALTFNFNLLLAAALNARKQGFTHFVMLHSDVASEVGFVDILLDELRAHNAGVVSCVIPIKNQLGLTTTAIGGAPGKPEVTKRLTVREARRLPKTFTAADAGFPNHPLLINTGCWICALRQPWLDEFPGFNIINALDRSNPDNVSARFFSEDWWFGVWLHAKGVKVMATTAVSLAHIGRADYRNDLDWGLETDPGDGEQDVATAIRKEREKNRQPAADGILLGTPTVMDVPSGFVSAPKKAIAREIVVVRYAESLAWVHGWLDDLLAKHAPSLTYRIYDKGPEGDTPNIGNLDWTYLHHIVTRWEELADWTIFTQADPFVHLKTPDGELFDFALLLSPPRLPLAAFPFLIKCREWGKDGRLDWDFFGTVKGLEHWAAAYRNGTIRPAKLSMREWFQKYLGVDIEKLGELGYHPGAIFGVDRETIQRRPKAFYEHLLASLGEGGHRCPEEAHYMERAWPLVFATEGK